MTQGFNVVAKTPWGQCIYNRHDTTIGKCLGTYGEYSEDELSTLRMVVRPGSVFLDVGANIGTLAIPMALHLGPAGAVIAMEPQRLSFQLLCANAALNSVANLYPLHAAAGEAMGEVNVLKLDPNAANQTGTLAMWLDGASEKVAMVQIDGLGLTNVSLIKIDVEGMEARVIEGARQTIARLRPILYVENDRAEQSAALIDLLRSLDYVLYWDLPRLIRFDRVTEETTFSNLVSINMLCAPKEHQHTTDYEPVLGNDDTHTAALKRTAARKLA